MISEKEFFILLRVYKSPEIVSESDEEKTTLYLRSAKHKDKLPLYPLAVLHAKKPQRIHGEIIPEFEDYKRKLGKIKRNLVEMVEQYKKLKNKSIDEY